MLFTVEQTEYAPPPTGLDASFLPGLPRPRLRRSPLRHVRTSSLPQAHAGPAIPFIFTEFVSPLFVAALLLSIVLRGSERLVGRTPRPTDWTCIFFSLFASSLTFGMASCRVPDNFLPTPGEPMTPWLTWKQGQGFLNHLEAIDAEDFPPKRKRAILFSFLGDEGSRVVDAFDLAGASASATQDEFQVLFSALDTHFASARNIIVERRKFVNQVQDPGETVLEYLGALRRLASFCDYGKALESRVADMFISGIHSTEVQDCLIREWPFSSTVERSGCPKWRGIIFTEDSASSSPVSPETRASFSPSFFSFPQQLAFPVGRRASARNDYYRRQAEPGPTRTPVQGVTFPDYDEFRSTIYTMTSPNDFPERQPDHRRQNVLADVKFRSEAPLQCFRIDAAAPRTAAPGHLTKAEVPQPPSTAD
ncbi:hypothetical protein HPB47_013678 [Ixodes persulcatus]|uniref:Uncharacterized protein n=1 Tax=Ixodes persulcatus TaxID=34615 RepID=A0AC60QYY4_IXOPE|nr:hypothetical protein HPB47_013678 [Ixodes persulcatus]